MTEFDTICVSAECVRPSDGWFLCNSCTETFRKNLAETPWMLDELETVVLRQVKYADQPGSASSAETPMVFNVKASEKRDELVNHISTSARLIADKNGWDETWNTIVGCVLWLERRISAVRLHEGAADIVDTLARLFAEATRIIDRPAPRTYLGVCDVDPDGVPCGGHIYGRGGSRRAVCQVCAGIYDADDLRKFLLKDLAERMCTAAEVAKLSTYLGLEADRNAVRGLVKLWGNRGRLVATDGRYRFGDAYELLVENDARKRGVLADETA